MKAVVGEVGVVVADETVNAIMYKITMLLTKFLLDLRSVAVMDVNASSRENSSSQPSSPV